MGVNGTFPKKSANGARKIKKRKSQRMQRTGSVPRRKQRTMSLQPIREQLLDVMVWEILIRLPVESLVRFKLVSKAWYAIISALFLFVRTSTAPNRNNNTTRLPSSSATLLYGRQFPIGEFGLVSQMAHCDGLVLLPTNTNAYVFNPATRDAHSTCLPIGFGLDVSTGTYKVARSFYRSCDCSSVAMGMEVFTINDKKIQQCPPQALLRFCLQDETFGIIPLLNNGYPTVEDDDDIVLHELDGELCATFFSKCVQRVLVWVARDIVNPEWDCHYVINVSDHCCPVASLSIAGGFLLRRGHCLIHYYMKAHGVKEDDIFDMDDLRFLGPSEDTLGHAWKNLCVFELLYYTASLVSITPKEVLQAS
ncbi:hypothetical protein VPH35_047225 [Triticum aestivum]